MADDPRKHHPEFTPSEAPTPEKRIMGVRVPPLRAPPEPPPEPKEEPAMPQKVEPVPVERGETTPQHPPNDPWVQRITAATALVVALSTGVWGGAKMNERDMPSSKQAVELTAAMNRTEAALTNCQRDVAKLQKVIEAAEKRDEEQTKTIKLQERQIIAHAHTIWFLNGHMSPIYGWPEPPRLGEWTSGTDNLHRHYRRGGEYPGSE